MKEYDISILTPTKNRIKLLQRLYESLLQQASFSSFHIQWLVGNDSSTDGTEEWLKSIHGNSHLHVQSMQLNGGGKHRSINVLSRLASGKYLAIVDDDDLLTDDAIERIMTDWSNVPDDVGELHYLKGNLENNNQPFSLFIDTDVSDNVFNFRYVRQSGGEFFEVYRTEHFNSVCFPEFDGETFLDEATKWIQLGKQTNGRFFNKVLYLAAYQVDGLTRNLAKNRANNPKGMEFREQLLANSEQLKMSSRIKSVFYYRAFESMVGSDISWRPFDKFFLNVISILVLPLSNMYAIRYVTKYKK